MCESNSNSSIFMENTFPENILYSRMPIIPSYVEPCKTYGGHISQTSREKARKRNRRK